MENLCEILFWNWVSITIIGIGIWNNLAEIKRKIK